MEKRDEEMLIELIVNEMQEQEFPFSPFTVLREVIRNESARNKLIDAFIAYVTASGVRDIAADSFELWAHDIVAENDPFPASALSLWEPVWVLLHETFGCSEAIALAQEFSLSDDDLQACGIEFPEIAAKIGCTQAEFALDFSPQLTAYLVFKSGECRFVKALRRRIGMIGLHEAEL